MTTLRVRLRKTALTEAYPFVTSYLVEPSVPMEHYYKRYGTCFSVPFGDKLYDALRTLQVNATLIDRTQVPPEGIPRNRYTRVVVPLVIDRYNTVELLAPRIDTKINSRRGNLVEQFSVLQAVLPPDETHIHLLQGTTNLCLLCPQVTSRLAGLCTPGCSSCHNFLRVPIDPLTHHPT